MYSRGPIVRFLEVGSALTALLAVGALAISLTTQSDKLQTQSQRISQIQQQRRVAIDDSCRFLRKIVLLATPPGRKAQGQAFINRTPLRDCQAYAVSQTPNP